MKKKSPFLKIIWSASKKDLILSSPWLPLYSLSEVALAVSTGILLQLIFLNQPTLNLQDLIPGKLKDFLHFHATTVERQDLIFIIPIIIISTAFLKLISGFMSSYLTERAGHAVAHRLREEMLIGFLSSPGNKLDHKNPDHIANQLMQDTTLLQGAISKGTISAARDFLVLLGLVLSMLLISWQTFFIGLAVILPISFYLKKISKKLNYYTREGQKNQIEIATRFLLTHHGALTVHGLRAHDREKADFEHLNQKNYQSMHESLFVRTFFPPATEFIAVCLLAGIYAWRSHYEGSFQASTYSSMIILLAFSFRYIKNIAGTITFFSDLRVVFTRLNDYITSYSAKQEHKKPSALPSHSAAAITVQDVSYVTAEGRSIISKCSLQIKRGTKVAFIGESGAGKTTLLRIIAGLISPNTGNVALEPHFLLASQTPYVFRGTVKENIVYTQQNTPPHMVDDKCHNLVMALGLAHSQLGSHIFLDKKLGFLGEGLSGGEKARVALARILFAQPKLILLDEPTANLDSQSAKLFWHAINIWKAKDPEHTVVAVSHARHEVADFDHFYLFEEGMLKRSGTHAEMNTHV